MPEEPTPTTREIDELLNRILPEQVAAERMRFLTEHADALLELRDRARRAYEEMLGHEVRVMTFDGLSPRLAESTARNNLGMRKTELDAELANSIQREDEQLRERLRRLVEDLEDESEA